MSVVGTMDRGKRIAKSEVPSVGTSGLLLNEKSRDRVEPSDSEGELEPLSPLNLSERDEDEYPEEDPQEDPEEDPKEDPDEPAWPIPVVLYEGECEGNSANSVIPTLRLHQGFYWRQLYYVDMLKATNEIHGLKRKLEERDAYVTKLEKEKHDWVARRDPPEPEVLIYGNGPDDVKGRKIRKYLREGKRILKYEDIVVIMSSRISGRFTRVSLEGGNHIGANPTEPGAVFGVPVIPPVSRGRGQGRGSNAIGANATEGVGMYEAPVVPTVGRGRGQRRVNVREPGGVPETPSYL
ncbi:hypothetical protein LXL04_033803 [Taraxacum kok-saghyz]